MIPSSWHKLIFTFIFLMTSSVYALPSDKEVAKWTEDVLKKTITVNYKQLEDRAQSMTIGKYYSGQAWSGLGNFFSAIIPLIIKQKLTTNPVPVGPAVVTQKGDFNGMPYWQVNQTFHFPVIDKYIWFSVIVIPNNDPPLIIETMSMRMNWIPKPAVMPSD